MRLIALQSLAKVKTTKNLIKNPTAWKYCNKNTDTVMRQSTTYAR